MAIEELDGLFSDLSNDADKTAMREILARNQKVADRLTQRETVYTAFVDGDTAALARVTAPPVVTTPPVVSSPASVDLDAINRNLDERMGKIFEDPRFNTAVETRAKALAEQISKQAEERAVGRALKGGAEITTILHNHRVTYGKELDQTAYEKFVTDNSGKFISLTAAYEAFTEADRIQKIKDDAFKAGQAARATTEVPGTTQVGAETPAGMFIKSNPMNTGAQAARGDALDAAAAAFRTLSAARVQ
jgi:hypothetical protein